MRSPRFWLKKKSLSLRPSGLTERSRYAHCPSFARRLSFSLTLSIRCTSRSRRPWCLSLWKCLYIVYIYMLFFSTSRWCSRKWSANLPRLFSPFHMHLHMYHLLHNLCKKICIVNHENCTFSSTQNIHSSIKGTVSR